MRFLPYPSTMLSCADGLVMNRCHCEYLCICVFLCISVFGGCSCICVLANLPCFASTLKLISIRWYGSLSCGSLDISYQHSNFCLKTSGFLDNLNFHKFNSKVIEFSTSILFSVLYILLINSIKLKWVELQSIQLDWYVKSPSRLKRTTSEYAKGRPISPMPGFILPTEVEVSSHLYCHH